MNDLGYYRQPTVAQDRIVFACEDDLWSVGVAGGVATRLTFSFGTCTCPKLSPDARSVAFISTDDGNPELYVMLTAGGVPQRLTHLGATAATCLGWSEDGSEIFVSANAPTGLHGWYERELFAYAVPHGGGEPRALNLGHVLSMSRGRDGAMALGRNASDPARWKRYRGGTSGEIWVDAHGSGDFERVALPDGNPVTPMLIGERLYFNAD
ncbi:MAG: S41 family peptidase, partial [Vulcanimicrobiaceae bacterium]